MTNENRDTLRKIIVCIVGLAATMGVTILTMVKGYGLTIDSWPWIILGTLLSGIITSATFAISK